MLSLVDPSDDEAYEKIWESFIRQVEYEERIKYYTDGERTGKTEESSELEFVSQSYKILKEVERSNLK